GSIGDDGVIMMSDCAVNINPSSEELAEIAVATAQSYTAMTGKAPRVALLSHSTKGSVKDDDAQKVVDAMELLQDRKPSFEFDGELQADAALVPSVGEKKSPGSNVAGKANVLVFPDLDAGNIGYKLAQRFGGALAYGPITQGLAMPMNDLSHGASVDDIVGVVTITAVQAQA
ncbi:MAG: phosphate acetyltransferase, partial [Eggerthellaceae bacterium]|nr:phosphate acetyltransferase [Eggerthellaceae bacterium]